MQIGSDGVQLLGGHGYVKEHPVERWYRDLRAIGVMEGVVARLMAINLEIPEEVRRCWSTRRTRSRPRCFRPISRKYDRAEHEYPKELDMLAALIDGMNDAGDDGRHRRARRARATANDDGEAATATAPTCRPCCSIMELCWGDVGVLLSMPRQGLGNAAIASVANDEQLERFDGRGRRWRSPSRRFGSRLGRDPTTAVLDGDEYVLNGEKIYVTAGERSDAVVVWATLDQSQGRAAIKSFVVEKGTPGHGASSGSSTSSASARRTPRRSGSPTAACRRRTCSARPEIEARAGLRRASCRRSTTPARSSPAMAVGVRARRAGRDARTCSQAPASRSTTTARRYAQHAAAATLPADGGRLGGRLPADAAGRLDGRQRQAELAAGVDGQGQGRPRRPSTITLRCVELAGALGYGET